MEVAQSLTKNKDLQTIFCYCWGDYGTIPSMSHFSMHALLVNHYKNGAFYPVGGASEIALNIIPVIERYGSTDYGVSSPGIKNLQKFCQGKKTAIKAKVSFKMK